MKEESQLPDQLLLQAIDGTVTVGGIQFKYVEKQYGGAGPGPRGIKIWRAGVAKDDHEYKFSPNPHDDPWYNKHQADFYNEAATRIGTIFTTNQPNAYPPFGTQITVHNIHYSLIAP